MDRLKRVPAWVVMAVLVAAVAAWAWWRSSKAKTDAEDQDQGDEEPARPNTMPASTPGSASGSVTVRNTFQGAAPSVPASCSSRRSIASIDSRIGRTRSGKAITPQARAAPVQRNANTMPR